MTDTRPPPESLSQDELRAIVGAHRKAQLIAWLEDNGWRFVRNAAGEPVVGRWYARMKLAGIDPATGTQAATAPDFSAVA